ncbi:conserved hypothetical protein TIGR00481 [Thermoplasmatales archaeon BRNA1]|nr:conserved hypothetical protein TIGR00481 [Thermoplasmatales archaeon BRNA1]
MDVSSPAFADGKLADKYGCKGTEFNAANMPSLSFPLKIEGAPAGTASFAIIFDDPDSVPVCGFKWVHWLVAGLQKNGLEEDASRKASGIVQGVTSWYGHGSDDRDLVSCYGGPYPPDRPHEYVLTVLALDFVPVLRNGFDYDTLMKVAKTHILAKATLKGVYSPRE